MANRITQREREIPIKNNSRKGYLMAKDGDGIDLGLNRKNHRGTVKKGISHTLKTGNDCGVVEEILVVRRLTARECFRLMGFTDEDYDNASQVCSENRLYAQAGNSIVVDVLEAIFKEML